MAGKVFVLPLLMSMESSLAGMRHVHLFAIVTTRGLRLSSVKKRQSIMVESRFSWLNPWDGDDPWKPFHAGQLIVEG
jgi:hypothetical protein